MTRSTPAAGRRALIAGTALAVLMALTLAVGPLLCGSPQAQNADQILARPSSGHVLGTDQFGRDVLARVLDGGHRSLAAAGVAVVVSALAGLLAGLLAAALRGIAAAALSRLMDVALGMPGLVVAFAIVGALGPGLGHLVLGLVIVGWAPYARLARGLALQRIRGLDVQAARLAGRPARAAIVDHVLPRVLGQLAVVATVDLGYTLVGLASLSYLGLGVAEPQAEWGAMLRSSQDFSGAQPYLLIGPTLAIAVTVAATSLIGEALKERARS